MDDAATRANYALIDVHEHLGEAAGDLDVPWADFAGDRSSGHQFLVPDDGAREPYIELQVFDVGTYGHEVLINGEPLSGFDIPPGEGWQFWMDAITGAALVEGENTLRIVRDRTTDDSFVVGTVVVNWKESLD